MGNSAWELLYGQREVLRELRAAVSQGAAHHAYLFHGPRGVGKSQAARAFAAALFAPGGDPSEDLLGRVLAGAHPDLLVVEPEGNFIRISQIQELQHALALKPWEGERMVAIIDEAEAMNEEAANTLLKTLEEPPGNSVIILVTSFPERLPQTVISRCCRLRFRPLRPQEVRDFLVQRKGIDGGEAERLTRLSGGILSRALAFLDDQTRMVRRREALEMASSLRESPLDQVLDMARRVCEGAEEAAKRAGAQGGGYRGLTGALDARTLQRLERTERARREREARRRRDQALHDYLEGFSSWFRDVVVYSQFLEETGTQDSVTLENPDYATDIHQASHYLYPEMAVEAVRACEKAGRLLARNANPLLVMENLLLDLHAIASRSDRPPRNGRH